MASVLLVEDDVFSRSTLAAALLGANIEVKDQVAKASEAIRAVQKTNLGPCTKPCVIVALVLLLTASWPWFVARVKHTR